MKKKTIQHVKNKYSTSKSNNTPSTKKHFPKSTKIPRNSHNYPTRYNIDNLKLCESTYICHSKYPTNKVNRLTKRVSKLDSFLKQQMAQSVWDPTLQKMMEHKDLINKSPESKLIWDTSYANELGRLSQGIRNIKGTDCIKFIKNSEVPRGRKVTYGKLVVDYRPTKSDPNRTRLTVGGNLLDYSGDLYTEVTDIISIKLLLNSVLSYQQKVQNS